jgi:hypothetical protein
MRQSTFPRYPQRASPPRVFVLNLILALLRAPLRRIGRLLGLEAGHAQEPAAEPAPAREQPPPSREQPVPAPLQARGRRRRPDRRPPPEPPRPARAKDVDEEPVLTAEFAEEGAEDGAGAEVHVEEPWEGYRDMKVADVTARLATATATELAGVQLYESSHRKRRSVLRDVERRLRTQQV